MILNYKLYAMKFLWIVLLLASQSGFSQNAHKDFYQIKVYHLKNDDQIKLTDDYLKQAFLPALHRLEIRNIGVFKPLANDTSADKLIYVLIPFTSTAQWINLDSKLANDATYISASKNFREASSDKPPFERLESILLDAFPGQQHLVLPAAKKADRVFELRSYESPTEHLAQRKMAMFNTGGEIPIFNRLKFNPVFYAQVVSGGRMPNFMYMPVFESVEDRNAQWKRFGNDAAWKDISTRPENENKVSVNHIDSILMHSTEYSDF